MLSANTNESSEEVNVTRHVCARMRAFGPTWSCRCGPGTITPQSHHNHTTITCARAGTGCDVANVTEAEPAAPPPDEVMVMLQASGRLGWRLPSAAVARGTRSHTPGSLPCHMHHSILYTLHSTLYTLHSTLYTLHSTLYTLHSTLKLKQSLD
jgi:hypothetical protein